MKLTVEHAPTEASRVLHQSRAPHGEGRRPGGAAAFTGTIAFRYAGQGRLASSPARAVAEEVVELIRQSVSLLWWNHTSPVTPGSRAR